MYNVVFKFSLFLYNFIFFIKTSSFIQPYNNKFCSIFGIYPPWSRHLSKATNAVSHLQLLHKTVVEINDRINPNANANNSSSLGSDDLRWTEEEVIEMAIGDPVIFAQELSSKVEAVIEEELNRQVRHNVSIDLISKYRINSP